MLPNFEAISICFRELFASILKADGYLHGLTTHKTAKLFFVQGTDNNIIYIYIYICIYIYISIPHGATDHSGPGPPHYRGSMIARRHTTLGTTPLDESARLRYHYMTTHNTYKKQKSMSSAGFELAIPASKPPQIHALESAITETAIIYFLFLWRCGPKRAMDFSFLRFLDHTLRAQHIRWDSSGREHYLTTHNTQH